SSGLAGLDYQMSAVRNRALDQSRTMTAIRPPTTPIATLTTITVANWRGLNVRPTIASEGTRMGGNTMSSAAAGPPPTPSDNIAWMIGTSPAVGITKIAPAT